MSNKRSQSSGRRLHNDDIEMLEAQIAQLAAAVVQLQTTVVQLQKLAMVQSRHINGVHSIVLKSLTKRNHQGS